MKEIVKHEVYGEICYEENFWTGKKNVVIDGIATTKIGKMSFEYTKGEEMIRGIIKGNYISGVTLIMNDEPVKIVPAPTSFEIVLSVAIFVLILVWGNSAALCSIIPVVGGAIGGGISGLLAFANLMVIRKKEQMSMKILFSLAFMVISFLLCYLVALTIISLY